MSRILRVAGATIGCASGLALFSATAGAQLVQGRVTDALSGLPLDGAVVTLVSQSDGAGISVFSDSSGGYRVRATRAGAHRINVKRIGYSPRTSATFEVSPATPVTVPEVLLSPRPQVVAKVDIAADQQCRMNPGESRSVVGLWDDVRTALEATIITASERRYSLRYTSFRRKLDVRLQETDRQSEEKTARGAMVWASIPADRLAREGYIIEEAGGGVMYRGLDAHVLLSQSFLETHCFRPAPKHPTNDSLVGLAFQPVRRGNRIDVRGVLWLNRASAELDAIDFSYEGLKVNFSTAEIGGRVEFDQLPSGRWIVDRWYIRMPRVEQRELNTMGRAPGRLSQSLVGYDEVGGAVFDISTADAPVVAATRRPVIRGTVHDSSTGRPLTGATISLADSTRSAVTDERGFFSLDSVPETWVALVATHPRLDSLGLRSWTWRVEGPALARTVVLVVPTLDRLLWRACDSAALPPDAGVLVGNLGDAQRSIAGIPVRVTWTVTSVSAAGIKRVRREASDTTGADGNFILCGVPTEASLRVELIVPGYQPESVPARIRETLRWSRIDIRVSR